MSPRGRDGRKWSWRGSLLVLVVAGVAAWFLLRASGAKAPVPEPGNSASLPADAQRAEGAPSPAVAWRVDSARAMKYVRQVVAFGPRPAGSAAHRKLQAYIKAQLAGVELEEDAFVAETPSGRVPMRNLIAKFPGAKDGILVIAGHYDTKRGLPGFVGANDGGSSTGLLLELANHLRGKQRPGHSVWLVWLDGEEAFQEFTETDGLFGSRHLAERWQKDGTARKVKAMMVVDMIGDADLNIWRDQNSSSWLVDLVYQAAIRLGVNSHFYGQGHAMVDDHLPFLRAGIPAIDLIDFEYGFSNSYWHTPKDTVDKLSPRSLEIVGNVVLETVRMLDMK